MFRERFRYNKQNFPHYIALPKNLRRGVVNFPGESAAAPKKGLQRVGTNTQVSDPASFAGRHFCAFVIAKAPTSRKLFSVQQTPSGPPPHPPQIFTSFCCISNPIVLLLVSNKGVRYFRASFFIIKVYFDINQ